MRLLEPLSLGARNTTLVLANRVMFGPHVTNLGDLDRQLTARHVAYYERRARGGCGVIVVEGASVHGSDWPYERAPLAERCGEGWAAIVAACRAHGTAVIASLDHAGGQGSSAYNQRELWAPSRVPEVNTREVPKWMEGDDIAAVIEGFGSAAAAAVAAGCDGVEVNAGQHSLVRQFLSGLTNQRDDEWGGDRLKFARDVLEAIRASIGMDAVLGLRLSCDELAPWAGITPDAAADIARELAPTLGYLVVTRGSIYSADKTRADFHEPPGYNIELCRQIKAAAGSAPVFLQGSVVDCGQAEWAITDGVCDGVEMTRAQIADPDLVAKVRNGSQPRPCLRCNQTCQVRDVRSPIVTCVGEPTSGRETEDPDWYATAPLPRDVLVIGAGIAGLETARVAAARGHRVRIVDRADRIGGVAALAGPGAQLVEWLGHEVSKADGKVQLQTEYAGPEKGEVVVQCTGSRPGAATYEIAPDANVFDVMDIYRGVALPEGPIALFDPIGGPIAIALAESLGARAILITQDQIAGNELSRSGDLAPANVRLAQLGVRIERRSILRTVRAGQVELQDRFSGERRTIACSALVDCGFRLPTEPLADAIAQAGDCVAPRTIHEAVLEARRVAVAL
ncbi:FAD-dependent oxidoreductase [soil metagenome]